MRLLLQRNMPGFDSWRNVHRFNECDTLVVLEAAVRMASVGESIRWRVVRDDRWQVPLLEWSKESGWRDIATALTEKQPAHQ